MVSCHAPSAKRFREAALALSPFREKTPLARAPCRVTADAGGVAHYLEPLRPGHGAMHYERARLCQRKRAELVFNGLGQSAASS